MAEAQHPPLAGMAMNLALAITMVIPCPFVGAVTDGGVDRVAVPIARPFVRVESQAVRRAVLDDQAGAGARVRIIAAPPMQLAHLVRAALVGGQSWIWAPCLGRLWARWRKGALGSR